LNARNRFLAKTRKTVAFAATVFLCRKFAEVEGELPVQHLLWGALYAERAGSKAPRIYTVCPFLKSSMRLARSSF
jgi:hypothetical protein